MFFLALSAAVLFWLWLEYDIGPRRDQSEGDLPQPSSSGCKHCWPWRSGWDMASLCYSHRMRGWGIYQTLTWWKYGFQQGWWNLYTTTKFRKAKVKNEARKTKIEEQEWRTMDEERRGMEEVKNERTNSRLSNECLRHWITALNMPMPSSVAREITTANSKHRPME